jgi:hypothetical protein
MRSSHWSGGQRKLRNQRFAQEFDEGLIFKGLEKHSRGVRHSLHRRESPKNPQLWMFLEAITRPFEGLKRSCI